MIAWPIPAEPHVSGIGGEAERSEQQPGASPTPHFASPLSGHGLRIGGLTPLTSLDFPGELAAVIFCQGCPWRCRYCHNGHLLPRFAETPIIWSDVEALFERRRGLLDAAVFSGGEPTMQRDLPAAMDRIKSLGFKIGLHTAGCYPRRLRRMLPSLDWIGLDIKALPEDYPAITGVTGSGERAWESLTMLSESGIALEVRTTLMPDWTLQENIEPLMRRLAKEGVANYVIQTCQTSHALDPTLAPRKNQAKTDLIRTLGNGLFRRFAIR